MKKTLLFLALSLCIVACGETITKANVMRFSHKYENTDGVSYIFNNDSLVIDYGCEYEAFHVDSAKNNTLYMTTNDYDGTPTKDSIVFDYISLDTIIVHGDDNQPWLFTKCE